MVASDYLGEGESRKHKGGSGDNLTGRRAKAKKECVDAQVLLWALGLKLGPCKKPWGTHRRTVSLEGGEAGAVMP